jgi:hypothetical protein
MPSVTLHLVMADRVLERWQERPWDAPFNPYDPVCMNAFQQGSFGPDLGYFPGGYRFLSDLSHLVRSGELTRALVHSARTPLERAFAWGWVTHVLADHSVHPLVGRGVGEFLFGDRTLFVDGCGNPMAHLRVETGLDAFYSHLFPSVRKRTMAPVFDGSSIRFLVDAYRRVYGLAIDPSLVLTSHMCAVRMSVQGLLSIGIMSTAFLAGPLTPTFLGVRWFLRQALDMVRTGFNSDSLLLAYLNPLPPAQWLVEEVGAVVEGFWDRFLYHYRTDLRELEDFNLDTGRVEPESPTHLGAARALATLARFGGRLPIMEGPASVPLPCQECGRSDTHDRQIVERVMVSSQIRPGRAITPVTGVGPVPWHS